MEARIYSPEELSEFLWDYAEVDKKRREQLETLELLLAKGYSIRVTLLSDTLVLTIEHEEFEKVIELPLRKLNPEDWD